MDAATDRDLRARALLAEWRSSDRMWHRTREEWIATFREFGFHHFNLVGEASELPPELRLYRGSLPEFTRNLSWTPSLTIAREYAVVTGGEIWTVVVTRDAVLAAIQLGDQLREYLVDVTADIEVESFGRPHPHVPRPES